MSKNRYIRFAVVEVTTIGNGDFVSRGLFKTYELAKDFIKDRCEKEKILRCKRGYDVCVNIEKDIYNDKYLASIVQDGKVVKGFQTVKIDYDLDFRKETSYDT